jgi:hypothetical protein
LDEYLNGNKQEIIQAPGNGFCFLESIRIALSSQKEDLSIKRMISNIMDEIYENVDNYYKHHEGAKKRKFQKMPANSSKTSATLQILLIYW